MGLNQDKKTMQIGNIMKGASGWDNPSVGRVYDQKGLSPTLNSCTGGGRQPYIIVRCDDEKKDTDSD